MCFIAKTKNSELIYTIAGASGGKTGPIQYNTMLTTNCEQYQVILPDGSHFWLNAASSLKYPTIFKGADRTVELTGEAYFEVAHNPAMPFRLRTDRQTVEVLGTHFNINSYADETATKTTLLQGSVKVSVKQSSNSSILRPGQQSELSGGGWSFLEKLVSGGYGNPQGVIYYVRKDLVP